jgi:hypothetical protein
MRSRALLHSPPPHPPSVSCAYLSHVLRPHFLTPLPSPASQPTPALSIASSSNSPTLTTQTLASDDPDVDSEGTALAARVSTIPGVSTALRAYEQSKASSRVVKVTLPIFPLNGVQKCDSNMLSLSLVRGGDDGVFREEHIAARH